MSINLLKNDAITNTNLNIIEQWGNKSAIKKSVVDHIFF